MSNNQHVLNETYQRFHKDYRVDTVSKLFITVPQFILQSLKAMHDNDIQVVGQTYELTEFNCRNKIVLKKNLIFRFYSQILLMKMPLFFKWLRKHIVLLYNVHFKLFVFTFSFSKLGIKSEMWRRIFFWHLSRLLAAGRTVYICLRL